MTRERGHGMRRGAGNGNVLMEVEPVKKGLLAWGARLSVAVA